MTFSAAVRETIPLDGGWFFCACESAHPPDALPPGLVWEALPLPAPSQAGGGGAGFLRREVPLRPRNGQRAWVRFAAIGSASVFFLNGKRIYASLENLLPVEFDISDHTDRLDNELIVWCGPQQNAAAVSGPEAFAPAMLRAPWRGVQLVYTPAVTIPDAAVRTLLRRGQVEVDISLENRTLEAVQADLHLAIITPRGEEAGIEFAQQRVELRAGVMTTLRFGAAWRAGAAWPAQLTPRRWSPEEPHLYHLAALLEQAGQVLDTRSLRFGFRELWQERGDWLLNGQPIRVQKRVELDAGELDGANPRERLEQLRAAGVDLVELNGIPPMPEVLDAADDCGMLLVGGYTGGVSAQHREDHLLALLRRDRSHASLVAWRLAARGEQKAALYALDPTRPLLRSDQPWPR